MKSWTDSATDLVIILVLGLFLLQNQNETARGEAVLAEISQIMTHLENDLKSVVTPSGNIPRGVPLSSLLAESSGTALIAKPSDPILMPDVSESSSGTQLGGCPTSESDWSVLRLDQSALTQIPERWVSDTLKVCLDRNGAQPPNRAGYDVIWLSLSRLNNPHVTLLPVSQ